MKRKDINLREITDYDNPIAGVDVKTMDYLIGKVFAHAELLGLKDRQAQAYKASLRVLFWEWYNAQFDNPLGLSDISRQARMHHGVEPDMTYTTSTSGKSVWTTYQGASVTRVTKDEEQHTS